MSPARGRSATLLAVGTLALAAAVVLAFLPRWFDPTVRDPVSDLAPAATGAEAAVDVGDAGGRRTTEAAIPADAATASPTANAPLEAQRGKVLVTVVDARTLAPVAGAQVVSTADGEDASELAGPDEQRAVLRLTSPVERLLRAAKFAVTDANGQAVVTAGRWAVIAAVKGDLYGDDYFEENRGDGRSLTVSIAPCQSLTLHTVDARHQPVPNVPVGLLLYRQRGEQPESCQGHRSGCTDGDGVLTLRLAEAWSGEAPPSRIEAIVIAPGLGEVRTPVPLDARSVELVLPAHGALRIRATDAAGRMLPDLPTWAVSVFAVDEDLRERTGLYAYDLGIGGEVRLPCLGLGAQLRVQLRVGDLVVERALAGPVRAGQEIVHTVSLADSSHFELRGRLLGASGAPLVEAAVVVHTDQWRRCAASRTDGDGRFCVRFPPRDKGTTLQVRLVATPKAAAPSWLDAIAMTLGQARDLGDLRLPDAEVVATGTIVAEGPQPLWISLLVEEGLGQGWERSLAYQVRTESDDRFAIHRIGAATGKGLRLAVTAKGCAPIEPIEFSPGQDLRVVLHAGGRLSARLLLDPAVAWRVDAAGLDLLATDEGGEHGYVNGRRVGDEWVFESRSLAPGIYSLSVESGDATCDLARIDGVRVAADGPTDARLLPWDLRGAIQLLTIRAIDKDGRRLDCTGEAFRRRESDGRWENCVSVDSGLGYCLMPAQPSDLLVQFDGFGVVRRSNVMGVVDLVVAAPVDVPLVLDGLPAAIVDAPLLVSVRLADGWAQRHGMPDYVDPIIEADVDLATQRGAVRISQPVDVVVRYVRGDIHQELAAVPLALSPEAREVHVATPPAVLEALRPWLTPK